MQMANTKRVKSSEVQGPLVPFISWQLGRTLVQSPLSKALLAIPIFGYLVLYSNHFQSWLATHPELGEFIFLSEIGRIKAIYYGSLLLLISTVLYYLCCPKILKRFASSDALVDHYRAYPSPVDTSRHIFESLKDHRLFGPGSPFTEGMSIFVEGYLAELKTRRNMDDVYTDHISRFVSVIRGTESFTASGAKHEELLEGMLLTDFASRHLSMIEDRGLVEKAASVSQQFYFEQLHRINFASISVCALAALGSLMIVAPAIETLLMVLRQEVQSIFPVGQTFSGAGP